MKDNGKRHFFKLISLIKPNSEASQTLLSSKTSRIKIMIRGFRQTAAGSCTCVNYGCLLSIVCFFAKHLTAHCLIIRLLCTLLLFKILMIVSIMMAHQLNWNKVSLEIFLWADKCENSPLASSTFLILDNKRQTIQVTVSEIYFLALGDFNFALGDALS